MHQLMISVQQKGAARFAVTVSGEIDLGTVRRLDDEVTPLTSAGARVALDCHGVAFMDSSGLKFLLRQSRLAKSSGGRLLLCAPSLPVIHVLELAEVTAVLDIRDDVQTALDELPSQSE